MSLKQFLISIMSVICILIFTEVGIHFFNKSKQSSYPLFFKKQDKNTFENRLKIYTKVDPLLGWAIHYDNLEDKSFQSKFESILLKNHPSPCESLKKIYISGGSTSDLIFDNENWPYYLYKLLKRKDWCFEIYVASVGGYNSGQELLKVIRDVNDINPDIHISYSGANEIEYSGYVSNYEYNLFHSILYPSQHGFFPNIKAFISKNKNPYNLVLDMNIEEDATEFWLKNMSIMYSISNTFNYEFVGILQPVFIHSNQKNIDLKGRKKDLKPLFEDFYFSSQVHVLEHDFLHDFTQIFKSVNENPFIDDCHLKDSMYQKMVADSIFHLIEPLLIHYQDSSSTLD